MTEFQSLLPENLQDKTGLALEQMMQEYFVVDTKPVLLCILNDVKEDILPFVAEMFHCLGYEGWRDAKSRKDKINVLKKSVYSHKKKGTLSAISNILSNSGLKVDFQLWKEFQGRPHTFRLNLNFHEETINKEKIHSLLKRINEYKQLRALPETIIIIDNQVNNYYSNFAFCMGQILEVEF